jgi:hypothetical protein
MAQSVKLNGLVRKGYGSALTNPCETAKNMSKIRLK